MPTDRPPNRLEYQGPTPPPPPPPQGGDSPREPSFGNPGVVVMVLFLLALVVLFGASLVLYVWTRVSSRFSPPAGSIHLPDALILSTVLVLGVSVALMLANRQIRAGRHRAYRHSLTAALALAAGFLTVQSPAMGKLLVEHYQVTKGGVGTRLYGLIFFLILLHALHVLGGMVSLVWVTVKAHRGAYERAGHDPIRNTAMYWHFLDVVWLVMFAVLYLTR